MVIPTKVFIGNLPTNCDAEALKAQMEKFGEVVEFDVINAYGFAHFANSDDALDAVKSMDGIEFEGRQIKVELSRSRVRQRPGMGETKNCYRCGKPGHWSKACPENPNADPYHRQYGWPSRPPYSGPPFPGGPPPPGGPGMDPFMNMLPPPTLPPLPFDRTIFRKTPSENPYSRPPPEFYEQQEHRIYGGPPRRGRPSFRGAPRKRPVPYQ